ncbi:MAG: 50S ribosomal protein L15 [Candidatus Omnitrophica bacterium]|nr:50S ribosomal protein L15 [Candidatus Omnitrophota bacterium]
MKLNEIPMPRGARRKIKRVGRGSGSGHGKTSGRGNKGLKSRSGGRVQPGFEGGQMPLIRRIPKRGFNSITDNYLQIVNIESLQKSFKKGDTVTPQEMQAKRLIKHTDVRVKILGKGKISKTLTVHAHCFSKSAVTEIESAGGSITVIKKLVSSNKKVQDVKSSS